MGGGRWVKIVYKITNFADRNLFFSQSFIYLIICKDDES